MKERQLEQLRERLIESIADLYESVQQEVRDSKVSQLVTKEAQGDEADESVRDQLRDLRISMAEADARRAQLMEAALRRMRSGDYGDCVDCGNEIEVERLRAIPWTSRCIDCQEAQENDARHRAPTL